jgi:hypothetical protein
VPEQSDPSAADVPEVPAPVRARPAPAPVPRINPLPVSDSIALKLSELEARLAGAEAPVKKAAPVQDAVHAPELPVTQAEQLPDVRPEPVPAAAAPFGAGLRAAVVAIVLLLATAAGLGAAAVVERGASPTDSRAVLAGALAAGLVLLLALVVLVISRGRSRER